MKNYDNTKRVPPRLRFSEKDVQFSYYKKIGYFDMH